MTSLLASNNHPLILPNMLAKTGTALLLCLLAAKDCSSTCGSQSSSLPHDKASPGLISKTDYDESFARRLLLLPLHIEGFFVPQHGSGASATNTKSIICQPLDFLETHLLP